MKKIVFFISLLIVGVDCRKELPKPPTQPLNLDVRDNFVGTYKVISESPNYYFTIKKLDTLGEQQFDIHNICNLFDMRFYVSQTYSPKNLIAFPYYFPITDKYNNRWCFGVYANDSIRNVNRMVNDTFRVYYRLHNTPWHGKEDTTYMDKYFLMEAVKMH